MKKQLLLVSDIDGTLLDSHSSLSDKNLHAIQHFMDNGHYFALSTGRTRISSQPILDLLHPNAPCIFMNGTLLQKEDGTIIQATSLNKELLIDFLYQLKENISTCVIEIFTEDDILIVSDPQNKDPFIEENNIPVTFTTIQDALKHQWMKILICDSSIQNVQKYYQTFPNHMHFNAFFSSDTFFEIVPKGISKGATLRHLANLLNCPCIAIGDFDNDLEMIKEADFGVAVANATTQLKDIADYISTDNDHDALAHLIQKLEEDEICQTL